MLAKFQEAKVEELKAFSEGRLSFTEEPLRVEDLIDIGILDSGDEGAQDYVDLLSAQYRLIWQPIPPPLMDSMLESLVVKRQKKVSSKLNLCRIT